MQTLVWTLQEQRENPKHRKASLVSGLLRFWNARRVSLLNTSLPAVPGADSVCGWGSQSQQVLQNITESLAASPSCDLLRKVFLHWICANANESLCQAVLFPLLGERGLCKGFLKLFFCMNTCCCLPFKFIQRALPSLYWKANPGSFSKFSAT